MIIVYAYLALVMLLLFFLAVMKLRDIRNNGDLTGALKVFGYPILIAGYGVDAFCNCLFPVWLIFLERPFMPGEYLVTDRLQRLYKAEGWRGNLARFFCNEIVQKIDRCHCE